MITFLLMILTAGITYYYTKRYYMHEIEVDDMMYTNLHNRFQKYKERYGISRSDHEDLLNDNIRLKRANKTLGDLVGSVYYDQRTNAMFTLQDEEIEVIGEL